MIEGVEAREDSYKVLQGEEEVAFDDGLSRLGGHDGWHEMKIPKGCGREGYYGVFSSYV
jgi:hypothetical protein